MGGRVHILAPKTDFHQFVGKMGGWHEKWSAYLKWLFHHYYGEPTEVGSFAFACMVLKRKHVDVKAKIFFKARDLAKHNFMGHLFGYFIYHMQNNGAPNFDGYNSSLEGAVPWTLESLHRFAEQYVTELNQKDPRSRPTADNSCPGLATEKDAIKATSTYYLRMSYQEQAVQHHNGYAYIRSLRLSESYLVGAGSTKYSSEIMRLMFLIFGDLSKRDAFIFAHDNFCNRDGLEKHYTEPDLLQEHQIFDLKDQKVNTSGGASFERMRRTAALTEFRHGAMAGLKKSVKAAHVSNKKTLPKSDDDCLYLAKLFIGGNIYHQTGSKPLRTPRRNCEGIGKKKLLDFSFIKKQLSVCAPPIYSLRQLQKSVRNSYVNRDADEDAAAAEAARRLVQDMESDDEDRGSVSSGRSSHSSGSSSVLDPHALDEDDLFDEDDWEGNFFGDSDGDEDDGGGDDE